MTKRPKILIKIKETRVILSKHFWVRITFNNTVYDKISKARDAHQNRKGTRWL